MRIKIFFACAAFAFVVAATPAPAQNAWTLTCNPNNGQVQPIQNGPVQSSIGISNCSVTGDIGGVPLKSQLGASYEERSATLYKAWGFIQVTLATGDLVVYEFQTQAPVRNGVIGTGQKPYTITGGSGAMKGITGSGKCAVSYPPTGGSVQACTGTYKLP